MAIGLIFAATSQCQFCEKEGICCSMSAGTNTGSVRTSIDNRRNHDSSSISFRCKNPLFGNMKSHWLSREHDLPLSNVRVAADEFSELTPDSSKYLAHHGYHPLEELKKHERNIDLLLTDAEIARSTVEANSRALLVFPGRVHNESHKHVSWAHYQYVIDDYGDMFFEFFDDESILQDPHASNPVTVLIGMENSLCGENRMASGNCDQNLGSGNIVDILFDDDIDEIVNTEVNDILIKWGMPETMRYIHPIYFSKCLAKSVNTKYVQKMEFPTNGVSLVGCLRPAFLDEESYLKRLFNREDGDGYFTDWRDETDKEEGEQASGTFNLIDGEILRFRSRGHISSTLYKFEIMSIELFSIYGNQSTISLQDFQDTEPDLLANSSSSIIEHFNEYMQCSAALKSLCRKKKGLIVETANLIGVDSLGMDVRISSGIKLQTLRFPFTSRATSVSAAEKKIKRMLFPRYQRKNPRTPSEGVKDLTSY